MPPAAKSPNLAHAADVANVMNKFRDAKRRSSLVGSAGPSGSGGAGGGGGGRRRNSDINDSNNLSDASYDEDMPPPKRKPVLPDASNNRRRSMQRSMSESSNMGHQYGQGRRAGRRGSVTNHEAPEPAPLSQNRTPQRKSSRSAKSGDGLASPKTVLENDRGGGGGDRGGRRRQLGRAMSEYRMSSSNHPRGDMGRNSTRGGDVGRTTRTRSRSPVAAPARIKRATSGANGGSAMINQSHHSNGSNHNHNPGSNHNRQSRGSTHSRGSNSNHSRGSKSPNRNILRNNNDYNHNNAPREGTPKQQHEEEVSWGRNNNSRGGGGTRNSNSRVSGSSHHPNDSPGERQPTRTRDYNKRRSQMRANPLSSVLQTQIAQSISRRDEMEKAALSDSDGSVSIDDGENGGQRNGKKGKNGLPIPNSTAARILAETEKKRAMFRNAKNKKGAFAKSSRKMPALEDSIIIFDEEVDAAEKAADGYIPDRVNILMEIVNGRNLLIADTTTSDPYVMIKLGDRDIHKTAKIMKTLNPHWTPESRSTFLLSCKAQELFAFGGVKLQVKDWDFIGGDDPMGHVFVESKDLLQGQGELKEYEIIPPEDRAEENAGILTIRYRKATRADYESLQNKEKRPLFVPELDSSIPETLSIMVEILHARNLLIADSTTSDPYVTVCVGNTDIHKTSKVMKK